MKKIQCTLITDGSSDQVLQPILEWLLSESEVRYPFQFKWVDFRGLLTPPRRLVDRICVGLNQYPCELLFVHRDAEREPFETRKAEVERALEEARTRTNIPKAICVIPVRMSEAWLLFDEMAIREAAGNPRGRGSLELPKLSRLEDLPDPKENLENLLIQASGHSGRDLKKFRQNLGHHKARVVDHVSDFSPLRHLSAFQALEEGIRQVIQEQGWDHLTNEV